MQEALFCSLSAIRQQTLQQITTKNEQSWVLSTYRVLFPVPAAIHYISGGCFYKKIELGNFMSPANKGVSERLISVNKTDIYSRTKHDENRDTDVSELPLVSPTRS